MSDQNEHEEKDLKERVVLILEEFSRSVKRIAESFEIVASSFPKIVTELSKAKAREEEGRGRDGPGNVQQWYSCSGCSKAFSEHALNFSSGKPLCAVCHQLIGGT